MSEELILGEMVIPLTAPWLSCWLRCAVMRPESEHISSTSASKE